MNAPNVNTGNRHGAQPIRNFLIPTTTEKYRKADSRYKAKRDDEVGELKKYAASLKEVLEAARNARLRTVDQLAHQLKSSAGETTLARLGHPQEHLVKELRESVEMTNLYRGHLHDVNQDIREIQYLYGTQATAALTGRHRGLQDWAEELLQTCSIMMSNLIGLSLAGVGLVYSTAFGAVRGNVGLMAFTFPLFTIGFIIPGVIQTGLKLAATQPRDTPFASQKFWTAAIAVSLLFSTLSVMAAVTILNVTIFQLHSDENNGIPRVSGIIAFAFCSSICLLLLVGLCLATVAKGPGWVFTHITHNQKSDELEDPEKYAFV